MKIPVTHYADVSPYEAIQAMKRELYGKYRCGGMYDVVSSSNGVLYGFRYNGSVFPDAIPIPISQEMTDVLKALDTLSTYYTKEKCTKNLSKYLGEG